MSECEEEGTCVAGGATTIVVGGTSPSSALRDVPSARISTQQEAAGAFPSQYRRTPLPQDNDFLNGSKIDPADYVIDCGNGAGSVDLRISQCQSIYPTASSWKGEEQGASAEGNWQLVVRDTATQSFVWKDMSTGLIWSSTVATNSNFCAAAGVNSASYNITCLDGGVDNAVSHCADVPGLTTTNGAGKGGLNATNGRLLWRLPTRSDFMQADVNGLRYVVPMGANHSFWSSSTSDYDIWQFTERGTFNTTGIRDGSYNMNLASVICVGGVAP